MDRLLNPLSDPALWSGVPAESADHADQRIAYHASTALRFTVENTIAVCAVEIPPDHEEYYLAFNFSSHDHPCTLNRNSDATYRLWIGNSYYTFSVCKLLSRVTLPITGNGQIKLESLHQGADYAVISDLRIIGPGFPADLLEGVKAGIEQHNRSRLAIGMVAVSAGDTEIVFPDTWEWLEENLVVRLGARRYQIKNRVNNTATLGYTYDGDTILEDFTGTATVEIPVQIGYYDSEAGLPGIALWYNSPAPQERRAPYERLWCIKNGTEMIMSRNGSIELWKVSIYIAAHSPELVAAASRAVRAFLAEYTVWCQGDKLWFNWIDPAADTDPLEFIDISPASLYQFEVEIEEDLWQARKVNPGAGRPSVKPFPFPIQARIPP
jgi:hypothetical protein